MTVKRFEDLEVWKTAQSLTNDIYSITRLPSFSNDSGLVNQIRRAGVSVLSNIAEGFERESKKELIRFLYISKGSCGEARCQLYVAFDQGYIGQEQFGKMIESTKRLSIMLRNFIDYLKKSNYKGYKHKEIQ